MNKAELVAAVAEKTALSKKDSEKAVNAAFEAITAALSAATRFSSSVSAHLRSRSATPASAATPRPRKRSRSPQAAFPFSRPVRL